MTEEKKRGVWFFLFGCSPMTLFALLGILVGLVLLPPLISVGVRRLNPPEPQVYELRSVLDGRSWMMVKGRWRSTVDSNDDGVPDCFIRVASGKDFFVTPDRKEKCVSVVVGLLGRIHGRLSMSSNMRAALQKADEFKRERGWLSISVVDSDGDLSPDCVLDRFGGVIARRDGRSCLTDDISIPASLELHEHRIEFEQLFQLENAVRRTVASHQGD